MPQGAQPPSNRRRLNCAKNTNVIAWIMLSVQMPAPRSCSQARVSNKRQKQSRRQRQSMQTDPQAAYLRWPACSSPMQRLCCARCGCAAIHAAGFLNKHPTTAR
eukprot:1160338-Pelagomonas_calceolata.AAC.7